MFRSTSGTVGFGKLSLKVSHTRPCCKAIREQAYAAAIIMVTAGAVKLTHYCAKKAWKYYGKRRNQSNLTVHTGRKAA